MQTSESGFSFTLPQVYDTIFNRFRSIFIMPRVDPQGSAVGRNFFDVKECQPVSSEDFLDRPKGQVRKNARDKSYQTDFLP